MSFSASDVIGKREGARPVAPRVGEDDDPAGVGQDQVRERPQRRRTEGLDDDVLDRPVQLSVEGIDDNPSLRGLADRLVGQLEMWVRALEGGTSMPEPGDTTPDALRRRLAGAGPRFRELVVDPIAAGRADETFVDAVCEPPETFTLGGVLAHVLTFAAVRRTMAVGALESAGITDLGAGDPMRYVGGSGDDASTITRRRAGEPR